MSKPTYFAVQVFGDRAGPEGNDAFGSHGFLSTDGEIVPAVYPLPDTVKRFPTRQIATEAAVSKKPDIERDLWMTVRRIDSEGNAYGCYRIEVEENRI